MKTIKVHHIYSRSLHVNGGPSKNLRRFLNNKHIFLSKNIDYELFTKDSFLSNERKKGNHIKSFIKGFANRLINEIKPSSSFFLRRIINAKYLSHSQRVIQNYLKQKPKSADIYVFDDNFDCYYFLKHVPDSFEGKVILFQHNSGVPLSMLEEYYPSLKKSAFREELYQMLKWTYSRVDRMIFIAQNGLKTFREGNHGVDPDKLSFFYNGIDDYLDGEEQEVREMISKRDYSNFNLVCAGTINSRKAQYLILEAFEKLSSTEKSRFHFTFLGEGPERAKIANSIVKKGWERYFELPGAVTNVNDYLRKSNLYILVSKDEGLPISIIEAEKLGLPIIGSIVAGIPEMIDDEVNGFLIDPDSAQLCKVLKSLVNFDLRAMSFESIEMFKKKFTFSNMLQGFIAVITITNSASEN